MKKNNSELVTELVIDNSLQSCIDFLEERKETSLFLLGNLLNYGFQRREHINSGNYRLLKRDNKIAGVFSLTLRGNLLIQTDNKDNYSHEIYEAMDTENIKLKGIIGHWKDCFLFKVHYETTSNGWKASFISKERLYSLPLNNIKNKNLILEPGLLIKLLTRKDFEQWNTLNLGYMKEINLPVQENNKERKQFFEEGVKNKHWWGVFLNKKLISIGAYNTNTKMWDR